MNSFSINRFGKTLRYVLSTNFRSLLMWTIGAALMVFMGEMLYWKFVGLPRNDIFGMLQDFGNMAQILFIIISLVLISSVVAGINDKRKRESFMMLPSTNAEKYISLIVYSTVVCVLCVFLAMILGDTLRMAFLWGRDVMGFAPSYKGECYSVIVDNRWWYGIYAGREVRWFDSALPLFWNDFFPDFVFSNVYNIMKWVVFVIGMVWIHSLYTLGGTLLRKYAFVTTSVVFILLVVFFAKFIDYYDFSMFHSEWTDGAGNFHTSQVGTMAYLLSIVLSLLSIANYWISFHIFKEIQLITNKWLNYDFYK